MCQVPVPECSEETGTPRPAEQQASFSFSLSFYHFTIHPARSILIIFLARLHIFAHLPRPIINYSFIFASILPLVIIDYPYMHTHCLGNLLSIHIMVIQQHAGRNFPAHPAAISPASEPS